MDWSTLGFMCIPIGALCGAMHILMKRISDCEDMILKFSEMQFKHFQHVLGMAESQRDILNLIKENVLPNEPPKT